jgi:aarF domain-containing kinase
MIAASIAQVHRAKLRDGTTVCIKVRKPNVDSILTADLGFLYATSKILEFINPDLKRFSLSNIVGDIRLSMLGT